MRLKSLVLMLTVLFAGVFGQLFAFDGVDTEHPLFNTQQAIFTSIADYWQVQEMFVKYIDEQNNETETNWNKAIKSHTNKSVQIGKQVMQSVKKCHYGQLELLSDIFKSLPDGAKNALYPALGHMKFEITHKADSFLTEEKFREYFPGYGYSEPGYKYRKGRELDREYRGVRWQLEEHSISSTWNVNLTVSIDLINILTGMVTGGMIKNLQVSEQYTMNVGGQPMIVCNVSFQRINAITTKTNRKLEINKVWFELLRAKSNWSNNASWEPTGKTYEILEEPTGEEVVTGIQSK